MRNTIFSQEYWYDTGYRIIGPGEEIYFPSIPIGSGSNIKGAVVNNFYPLDITNGQIRRARLRFNLEYVSVHANTYNWYVEGRVVNTTTESYPFDTLICSYALFLI